jgi:hypothetical protein
VKDNKNFLEVNSAQPLKFKSLANLIASALHPNSTDSTARAATQSKFDIELREAVKNKRLDVYNYQVSEKLVSPSDDELLTAKIFPETPKLKAFVARCGLELRYIEDGNGPELWTLKNAAQAIQKQEEWHDGVRDSFLKKLIKAASDGSLIVRDPHDDFPYRPSTVREFHDLVTPDDLDAWFVMQGRNLRFPRPPKLEVLAAQQLIGSELGSAPTSTLPIQRTKAWTLKTSITRFPGYRHALYEFLKAEHVAEKPLPKARDVLNAWVVKSPLDIQVMTDGIKYNDCEGNPKEANLKNINMTIAGLLEK